MAEVVIVVHNGTEGHACRKFAGRYTIAQMLNQEHQPAAQQLKALIANNPDGASIYRFATDNEWSTLRG